MDKVSAQDQSLSHHLALAAWRGGHGNGHLFDELMRTTYVAWFLQQDGYGSEPVGQFKTAEYAVAAALERAQATNERVLTEDDVPAVEKLLALHDDQLAVAPLPKVIDAESRLRRFLAGTSRSPIPERSE